MYEPGRTTTDDIPMNYLLKSDEIAALLNDQSIFSLTPLHPVLEKRGFFFVSSVIKHYKEEVLDFYSDSLGHAVIVTYKDGALSEVIGKKGVLMLRGYMVENAEFYDPISGTWEKIDIKKLLQDYPKNVFDSVVKRIKDFMNKREEISKRMIV